MLTFYCLQAAINSEIAIKEARNSVAHYSEHLPNYNFKLQRNHPQC